MPEFQTTINSITTPEFWGKPRFSFGDRVKWQWAYYESYGIILGFYYRDAEKEWYYIVKNSRLVNRLDNCDCFLIENIEEMSGSDVKSVSGSFSEHSI